MTKIARAFLVGESAMEQRITRAKAKVAKAGAPFETPGAVERAERLAAVAAMVYLLFNEGYSATAGPGLLRHDLCLEAIRMGRLMLELVPGNAECEGLLALMLLNHSRATARLDDQGRMIALEHQDRSLWNRQEIAEGLALLDAALARGRSGVFQLQAAISALHAQAPSHAATGWREIVLLYEGLHRLAPNAVYLLNRAVALSYASNAEDALAALAPLEDGFADYQPFHAAKADFLRRTGRLDAARQSYRRAIALSANESERQFLETRLAALDPPGAQDAGAPPATHAP